MGLVTTPGRLVTGAVVTGAVDGLTGTDTGLTGAARAPTGPERTRELPADDTTLLAVVAPDVTGVVTVVDTEGVMPEAPVTGLVVPVARPAVLGNVPEVTGTAPAPGTTPGIVPVTPTGPTPAVTPVLGMTPTVPGLPGKPVAVAGNVPGTTPTLG